MATRKRTGFQVKASTRFEEEGDESLPIDNVEFVEAAPVEVVISEDPQLITPVQPVVERVIAPVSPPVKPVQVNQPAPPRKHRNIPRFSRSKGT